MNRIGIGPTRHRSRVIGALALAAAAALAAGCSSSGSSAGNGSGGSSGTASKADFGGAADYAKLQTLYQKAVKAGQTKVVIYGPTSGTDQKEWAAFKSAFPKITVSGQPVVGPPMDAKLSAEFGSGKHVGDIAYTGSTDMLQYMAKGYFTPYTPVTATDGSKLVSDAVGPNHDFYGASVSLAGTVTNTNTVKTPPTDYSDLESSAYKNKIAMYDPTAIGEMADIFAHLDLQPKYKQLMAKLKANNAQLFPAASLTGPLTAVAQGAKTTALGVGYAFYEQAKASGAPVQFSTFNNNNYTVLLYQGILKGAPDSLAAELYESWMFTPAAAKVIAGEGSYSAVKGATPPAGLKDLSSYSLQPTIPLTKIVAADNAAVDKAKQYWGG